MSNADRKFAILGHTCIVAGIVGVLALVDPEITGPTVSALLLVTGVFVCGLVLYGSD